MKFKKDDIIYCDKFAEIILLTSEPADLKQYYYFEANRFTGYSFIEEIEEMFVKIGEL